MTPKRKPEPRLILDKALGGYRLWLNGTVILTFTAKQIPTIAAAPDTLAACQVALQLVKDTWIEDHGSESVGKAWGALQTAISKATGE